MPVVLTHTVVAPFRDSFAGGATAYAAVRAHAYETRDECDAAEYAVTFYTPSSRVHRVSDLMFVVLLETYATPPTFTTNIVDRVSSSLQAAIGVAGAHALRELE